MSSGTVKWFSVARKYGFIVPDEGGKDVFVHMSALNSAELTYLEDGARVTFELEESDAKRSAVNLTLLTAEAGEASQPAEPAEAVAAAA